MSLAILECELVGIYWHDSKVADGVAMILKMLLSRDCGVPHGTEQEGSCRTCITCAYDFSSP